MSDERYEYVLPSETLREIFEWGERKSEPKEEMFRFIELLGDLLGKAEENLRVTSKMTAIVVEARLHGATPSDILRTPAIAAWRASSESLLPDLDALLQQSESEGAPQRVLQLIAVMRERLANVRQALLDAIGHEPGGEA